MITDEELARRYADAARKHGEAMAQHNSGRANRMSNIILDTLKIMRQRSDRGRTLLEPLLENKDASVRCWAATHFLPLDDNRAITVLQFISRMKGVVGFDAEMVLKEWEKGNLRT